MSETTGGAAQQPSLIHDAATVVATSPITERLDPGAIREWDEGDARHLRLAVEVLRVHQPDQALVERVARAIVISDGFDWDRDCNEAVLAEYWVNARAALAALRDPA